MSGRWVAGMAAPGTQALLRWRLSWLTSPGLVPAHPTRCSILLQIVHLKPESPWQPPGEHLAKATPASAVTSSPILARPPAPASSLCEASPSVTIGWSGLLGVGEATMGSLGTLQSPASVIALLLSQWLVPSHVTTSWTERREYLEQGKHHSKNYSKEFSSELPKVYGLNSLISPGLKIINSFPPKFA